MWVWQSHAPAGTSKFTGVAGWEALANAERMCMVAPAASAPIRISRRVSMGFLLVGMANFAPPILFRIHRALNRRVSCVTVFAGLPGGVFQEKRHVRCVRNRGLSHRNRGRRDTGRGSRGRERGPGLR